MSGSKRGGLFISSPWSQSGTEVHFDLATWALTNYPAFVGAGVANTFLIHAQDTNLAGADTGGDLHLRPGNGTTDGELELQDASGNARVTIGAVSTTLEATTNLIGRASGGQRWLLTAALNRLYVPIFQFANNMANPVISQDDHPGAGIADTLLIHAQDTDLAGGDTGGDLHLRPGNGTTDGELELQDANGTARLIVTSTSSLLINATLVEFDDPLGAITFRQQAKAAGSGAMFTIAAQSASQAAVVTGGGALFQAGDATSGAAVANVGGNALVRAGDASGTGASVGGDLDLRPGAGTTNGQLALQDGNGADTLQVNDADVAAVVPFGLPSYTVAGVPAAGSYTAHMIYVSNESGGAVPAFSDGVNWRRVTDRAIIT